MDRSGFATLLGSQAKSTGQLTDDSNIQLARLAAVATTASRAPVSHLVALSRVDRAAVSTLLFLRGKLSNVQRST